MQHLAPISLFVYNRPEHTRRTISHLQKNLLADESRLIIFSDAPKSEKDKDSVERTREFIKTVDGFKSIRIVERTQNMGLAESIIDGVSHLNE
jgi:GT2 family glycosyltransferase